MDPILFWNDVALEANRVSFTSGTNDQPGPPLSARALAIVHLAMYDAYAGVHGFPTDLPKYNTALTAPTLETGASVANNAAVAVAAAAHATLSKLYPSQKAFFVTKHLEAKLSSIKTKNGQVFGKLVAEEILKDRDNDGGVKKASERVSDDGYSISVQPGAHRPDPDNAGQGFHAPFYGKLTKSFAVTSRHPILPPPLLTNNDYKKSYEQVYAKGIAPGLMGTLPTAADKRNAHETIVGIFWAYDGARKLGTPPRLYNLIIRAIADAQDTTIAENARLFALVNVAMADAGILAWEEKYRYEFWRPVVAIRNDEDDPDSGWLPLGSPSSNPDLDTLPLGSMPTMNDSVKNFTPPFPAYPSGHATFGAAAFTIAEKYFAAIRPGVDVAKDLKFVSGELDGISKDNKGAVRPKIERTFAGGFKQMIEENGFSRIFLGVHWSFDAFAVKNNGTPDLTKNTGGVPLGTNIANDIFANKMKKSNV
jgi:membrane-associated phospholipid phosphatase